MFVHLPLLSSLLLATFTYTLSTSRLSTAKENVELAKEMIVDIVSRPSHF